MKNALIPLVLAAGIATGAHASTLVVGFETTQGSYTANQTIIGVTDTGVGAAWRNQAGTNATKTVTTVNPYEGTQALRFNSPATALDAAAIDLSGGINLTTPFTFSFALNLEEVSAGTGTQFGLQFGSAVIGAASPKNWVSLWYNNGALELAVSNALKTGAQNVNLGNYTTYSALGEYIYVSLSIDPSTMRYIDVAISGTNTSSNLTSLVQSVNGGIVPWSGNASATLPGGDLLLVSGSNDRVLATIDAISVAPAAIPEPGSVAMLLLGGGALAVWRRRSQKNQKSL